ncbi:MAG: hypothetical protein ABR548_09555 [Actinomycetota bacterium]|nr:hypothetical protein [Actinomycetota bacterium]
MGIRRKLLLSAVLCGALAFPLQARATTSWTVDHQFAANVYTWTPAPIHAAAGDTITWRVNPGCTGGCIAHNVVQYAGTGTFFDSGSITSGTYTQTVQPNSAVWYRCTLGGHSRIDTSGTCLGMCGGYTTAPGVSAPVVTLPTEGNPSVQGTNSNILFKGTADPYSHLMLYDGTAPVYGGGLYVNSTGSWSVTANLQKGHHTINVKAFNPAGDVAQTVRSFTVVSEANPPQVRFSTLQPGPVLTAAGGLTGTTVDDSSVLFVVFEAWGSDGKLAAREYAQCSCPTSPGVAGGWSISPGGAGMNPGVYQFRITAHDTWDNINYPAARATYLTVL